MAHHIGRRKFLATLGGAAAAWPLVARAQRSERVRRVGVLIPFNDELDSRVQEYLPTFKQRLHDLGWIENRNIRFEYRFTGQNLERIRTAAQELIAHAPDVIVVWANPAAAILQQATQSIPIVFALVSDPLGGGFVPNLAHPGGNITGFQNFETAIGGKWLEVLSEVAPGVRSVAFLHSPSISAHLAFMNAAETASKSLGVTLTAVGVRNAADIEPALTKFAQEPNGGLIIAPMPLITTNHELIIASAARLHLPAIYPFRYFCTNGGLVSYGFDTLEQHRGAASYVDRILKGENPGNLPVQAPTKYELVINLKTAKALGLTISRELQLRAEELVE
jgi:ABC-type uncharacterized transport system substrate-binding protein